MKDRLMKVFLKHLLYFSVIASYLVILQFFHISCPFRFFTGIPCPACGTTRALLALTRLDFSESIFYNPAALAVVALVMVFAHAKTLRRKLSKRTINTVMFILVFVVLLVYLIRIIWFNIP